MPIAPSGAAIAPQFAALICWLEHAPIAPQLRLTDRLLSVFGTIDRPSRLLGAFATTDSPQTTASTAHFLGAFGRTGNPEELVQRPNTEPANINSLNTCYT